MIAHLLRFKNLRSRYFSKLKDLSIDKQNVCRMYQEKIPNKLYMPSKREKKTVVRPRTTVDESILH